MPLVGNLSHTKFFQLSNQHSSALRLLFKDRGLCSDREANNDADWRSAHWTELGSCCWRRLAHGQHCRGRAWGEGEGGGHVFTLPYYPPTIPSYQLDGLLTTSCCCLCSACMCCFMPEHLHSKQSVAILSTTPTVIVAIVSTITLYNKQFAIVSTTPL